MAGDIIQMQNRNFVATMIINGEKAPAFSGTTLVMPKSQNDLTAEIVSLNRQNFTASREEVEAYIRTSSETTPLAKGLTSVNQPDVVTSGQTTNPASSLLGLTGIKVESDTDQPKKRKRKRSRKKKNQENQQI